MSIKAKTAAAALFALPLALGATAAHAQTLTGKWRGFAHSIEYRLQVTEDGRFVEDQTLARRTTELWGEIRDTPPDTVEFVVEDWDPKTEHVVEPTNGSSMGPGSFTERPIPKPVGGIWRVTFNGPDNVTLTGLDTKNVLTFKRVH